MNEPPETAKKRKKLPSLGVKLNQSSDPEEEQHDVKRLLLLQKELLEEQKIEKNHLLISAEWDDGVFEAKVTKNSGSSLEVFGHNRDRHVYLYAEEALYLIEMNKLQLFYNGIRLSVQRSYSVLLQSIGGISLHQYEVYKHFVIQGFKLFRRDNLLAVSETRENLPSNTESEYGQYFKKLRIFESCTEDNFAGTDVPQISYDVFAPNCTVKKSRRPEPNYHLVILNSEEKLWNLLHLANRTGKTNLLFASAEGKTVSVFNLQSLKIPNLH